MNSIIKTTFIFALGAATGTLVTLHNLKNKYDNLLQEEIDSMRRYFEEKQKTEVENTPDIQSIANEAKEKPSITEYTAKLQQAGYVDYTSYSKTEEIKEEKNEGDKPYVIDPDEYGVLMDYREVSLTHYADGILVNENDEVIYEVDKLVGADYADHFGDYEDDAVHIRNDILKCDIEILMDVRPYSELVTSRILEEE